MPLGFGFGLPQGLALSASVSAAMLFANGEQGLWLEPADMSTLFQDSIGTIPVTGFGQPVGLILDKSRGLALGPQLVSNGNFAGDSTAGWTGFGTGIPIAASGGVLTLISDGSGVPKAYIPVTTEIGATYLVQGDVTATAGITTFIFNASSGISGGVATLNLASGNSQSYKAYGVATATTMYIVVATNSTTGSTSRLSNVVVKKMPGYHALQSVSTKRPLLVSSGGMAGLQFDGVDDFLQTPVITHASDKMQFWTGLTKLSDAARGTVFILSSGGRIALEAPGSALNNFITTNGGTVLNGITTTVAAPNTSVISVDADIAAPILTMRRNGVQVSSLSGSMGTGNFPSGIAMTIGAGAAGVNPLNGILNQLLLRFGPNLTVGRIAAVDRYVNSRTGAYLNG